LVARDLADDQKEALIGKKIGPYKIVSLPGRAGMGVAETRARSMVGRQLGAYKILSVLGAGGMGEVYRAEDTKLGRQIAIKVLPDLFAKDPERLARFEREAKLLASLNHSGSCQGSCV
jgi:serine/threonine protein kinase